LKSVNNDTLLEIKGGLSGFIMDGLSGGFKFDEEAAKELQQIEGKIDDVVNEQKDTIEYLEDALLWRKQQIEIQTETTLQLRDDMMKIKKVYNDKKLTDEDVVNELIDILEDD